MKNLFTLCFLLLAALAVNAQTVILEENFEGTGLPSGWTQETDATDGGWKFGAASALSSSSFPITNNGTKIAATNDDGCNCDKGADYLIFPALDLSGYVAVSVKFDMFYGDLSYQSIQEHAYLAASTDGGATWTDIATLPGAGDWQTGYTVDVSAYAGNSSVMFAFHYTDGGGWLYGWAVDNVSVFAPADFDAGVLKLNVPRFELFGSSVVIKGEMTNQGAQNLTSFDLVWSDGINMYTDNVTGVDIPYLGTYTFEHSTPLSLPQAVSYNFSVWVANPNGETDANDANNQLDGVVSGVTYIPAKKMFVEEATGTWCGWCPRGTEWMDYMAENFPDEFVGVAVHNGDPMVVTEYDNGVGDFPGFSGYPSVIVDRDAIWDPSDLGDILPDYVAKIAPVAPSISAQLDVVTKALTIDAGAEFVTQLENLDYRLNVVLTEDNVHGTGSGYNQVNYYAGAAAPTDPIPNFGLNWDDLPATVPAAQMYYNHVARAILGGWAGSASSIPAAVVAGDVATKNYAVNNFNTNWNPFNMHAVVMVIDNATGQVLNAESNQIDVICPTDLGLTITVTEDTVGTDGTGTIMVSMADPNLGFGGYTFSLNNGATGTSFDSLAAGGYTLTVADKIGCAQEVEVTVGAFTSVQDIKSLSSFSLTPNPASSVSVLNVRFTEVVDLKAEVINAAGQVMETAKFDHTTAVQHTFDLGSYADGIYLVKVSVGNQVHTERLIIAR